ncbi:hypothetical protein JCM10295v2_004261 [Rhodotorula toruloides]
MGQCEGGSAPCVRCKQAGAECVFDKPASSVVEDAGLTRLSAIEAALATNERRMDTLVQQMGEVTNVLMEVVGRLKQYGSSQPGQSPAALPYPANQVSPFGSGLDASGLQHPTPPFGRPRPLSAGSPSLSSLPNLAAAAAFRTSPVTSGSPSFPRPPSNPSSSQISALDALAHLASSNSPDVHRFASRVRAPISALQDAVAEMGDEAETKSDELLEEKPETAQQKGASEEKDGERPAKRSRIAVRTAPTSPDQFDLVAKGLIGDKEARALVLLWMKECANFCAVLDQNYDTYESLRKRSPFLFNTVLYTALRAQERCSPPSTELVAAAEETRRFARNQVFESKPSLESIQATMVLACYHQQPYILSGMALRLALAVKLDTSFEQLEAHGWHQTDEKARRLTAQLRTWIYIVTLNAQHERNLGVMSLMRQEDVDALVERADRALSLPHAIGTDYRHIANLRLCSIVRIIMQDTAAMAQRPESIADQIAYYYEKAQLLNDWHTHYDQLIAAYQPSPLAWARRSHSRMYHDAKLGLLASIFKSRLFDPPATDTFEITRMAQEALADARTALQMVLGSPVYRSGTQWSGYLLRTDMSFACLFLLKSGAAFPQLVNREEVARDVQQVAELLSNVAGSQRYAAMLLAARDQYLERTAPPPEASGISDLATASNLSETSAAGEVYPAQLPTLSQPLEQYGNGNLSAFSSISDPANIPVGTNPSSVPQTPFSALGLSSNGAGNAGMALMPGEMDIDWSIAMPLFDDSLLSQHDWMATVGNPPNWFDNL